MAKADKNGLYNPRSHPDGYESYRSNPPSTINEAIDRGFNQYINEDGVEIKLRFKSRAKEGYKGAKFEAEPLATRDANRGSDARRAATNEQTLTLQDYLDYAKRNGYSKKLAESLYNQNQEKLKKIRKLVTESGGSLNYEHLLPTRSPMRGGVEHWRNIIPMNSDLNSAKSDKLASILAAQRAQVPLTKSGALQADFGNKPPVSPEDQQQIILEDIEAQGPDVITTRKVRQTLNANPNVVSKGQKFTLLQSRGGIRLGSGETLNLLENIAQAQSTNLEELAIVSRTTAQNNQTAAEIAQVKGGIRLGNIQMPDFGISESIFGKSAVQDERQIFLK